MGEWFGGAVVSVHDYGDVMCPAKGQSDCTTTYARLFAGGLVDGWLPDLESGSISQRKRGLF